MREVVYLSEGKIQQFLPEHGRTWSLSRLSIRSPVAGVDVDRAAATDQQQLAARLRDVEKHIAKTAIPYTEPLARVPGTWVEFRAPLSYATVEQDQIGSMVLFVQPEAAAVSVAWGRRVRLLLHGSARHLLGRSPQQLDYDLRGSITVDGTLRSGSDSESFSFLVSNADMLSNVFGLRRIDPRAYGISDGPSKLSRDSFDGAMANFMSVVDEHLTPGAAAWMAGYARVTQLVKDYSRRLNYLVASPLYVMYSTPIPAPAAAVDGPRWPDLENIEPIEWPEQ